MVSLFISFSGYFVIVEDDDEIPAVRWTCFVTSFIEDKVPSIQNMPRNTLFSLDLLNLSVWENETSLFFQSSV